MSGFTFKQFHINQQHCAMKVGTDGILLGSWAQGVNPLRILDLGTGTGVLALMLAQRYPQAKVYGVELDKAAFLQAQDNVKNSPFADRINLYEQDIADFAQKCSEKKQSFDLIVANPPYFAQGVACANTQRELARYTQQSHLAWLIIAEKMLSAKGNICFVLPYEAGCQLKTQLRSTALFCIQQCDVVTKIGKPPQRMLLNFSKEKSPLKQTLLVVYDEQNRYSDEFKTLTQDFYLNF